jgi:hypothetical protein
MTVKISAVVAGQTCEIVCDCNDKAVCCAVKAAIVRVLNQHAVTLTRLEVTEE